MKRIALILLLLAGTAFAQTATRFDGVAQTTRSINGNTLLVPSPNAVITVCTYPATGGLPCTNKASVCPDSTGVGCTTGSPNNPITADAQGNFGFWALPGTYQYSVCPTGGVCRGPYSASFPYTGTGDIVGNATSASRDAVADKAFYNAVTDCSIPTNAVTSITTAMQACIDAHPGKRFVIPAGTYAIGSTINYKGQGMFIDCEGKAGVTSAPVHLVVDSGVTPFVASNSLTQKPRIENCWIDGAEPWVNSTAANFVLPLGWGAGTSDSDGFRCYANGCVARGNLIQDMGRHGINIDTTNYSGNANSFVVEGNRIMQNRGMGIHIQGVDSNQGRVTDNTMVANQLGGGIDDSFLGNWWANNLTDLNGVDQTTPGATKAITNSVITKNFATITMAAHGFAVGDNLFCTGTLLNRLNGRWQVLDVPDANNVVIWSLSSSAGIVGDRASAADTGTCAKMPGSSQVWVQTLTGCSTTNASTVMTCTGGGYQTQATGYFVNVPGAGVAGANLVTQVTPGGTSPNTFALRTAAGATLGPVSVTMIIYPQPYKAMGNAQLQGHWTDTYCEAAQNPSQFNYTNTVIAGDMGCLVDTSWGSNYQRGDSGGTHYSMGNAMLFDNGNNGLATQVLTFTYVPGQTGTGGGGSNGTTQRIFKLATTGATVFNETVSATGWTTTDTNSRTFLLWAPTASAIYSGGGEVRLGSDSVTARVGFRSSNTEKASIESTGQIKGTLYGTLTNCSSAGGTCAAAPAGSVSIAAAATTVTVATTAVTANSQIIVTEDSSLGTKLSVTCNTTTGRTYTVTTRTAGTSFVITSSAAPVTNPACLSYSIVN